MSNRRPRVFDEPDWTDLLSCLDRSKVIPVVGEQLSILTLSDGSEFSFADLLTLELREDGVIQPSDSLQWPDDPRLEDGGFAGEVGRAQARILNRVLQGERHRLEGTASEPRDLLLSDSLRHLVSIPTFPMIVTTAVDGLLGLAARIQCGEFDSILPDGPEWKRHIVYLNVDTSAPESESDLHRGWKPTTRGERDWNLPIYHIFGLLSSLPGGCARRDSQQLEVIIRVAGARLHPGVLKELARCDILLIGNQPADCLTAALVRLVKGGPFHETRTSETLATANNLRPTDPSLLNFLARHGRTRVYESGDTHMFLSELHRRWNQFLATQPGSPVSPILDDQCIPPDRCVFLSYASEDRALAQQVYDFLTDRKLSVWYDRERLRTGETWNEQLQYAVKHARLILPLITPNSARRPGPKGRFYLKEWTWAQEQAPARTGNAFIVPLIAEPIASEHRAYITENFGRFDLSQCFTKLDALLSDAGFDRLLAAYHRAAPAPTFLTGVANP